MLTTRFTIVLAALTTVVVTAGVRCEMGSPSSGTERVGGVDIKLDKRIWVIAQTENGDVWFGSNGNGAYRYDGENLTRFGHEDGLVGRQVRDIKSVPGGHVLVSTNSGVFLFDGERFSRVKEKHARTPDDGWRLSDDDVWVVYKPGDYGPSRYDGEVLHVLKLPESQYIKKFLDKRDRQPDRVGGVYSTFKDSHGFVWIGTEASGLCRYDGESLHWMYEGRLTTTPSGGSFGVRSIFEDSRGDYWICNTRHRYTFSAEPEIQDGESVLAYERKRGVPESETDSGLNFSYFHSVAEDKDGRLWMACGSEGVLVHSVDSTTRYSLGSDAYAINLMCDADGKVWVGTLESGAFVFDGDGFEPFAAKD